MDTIAPLQTPVAPSSVGSQSGVEKPSVNKVLILVLVILVLLVLGLSAFVVYLWMNRTDEDGEGDTDGIAQTCEYGGETYREGESFDATDGCNTCSCVNGEVVCTTMACEMRPEAPDTQIVELSFSGPTGIDRYNISFNVPIGDVQVVSPDSGEYPSASYLDGGTYYIQVVHPYEIIARQYASVEKRDVVNENYDLGDIYLFPVDLSMIASDAFPAVSAATHVAYGVVNEVSLTGTCTDMAGGSISAPCGLPGILGTWSDPETTWPFLTLTCIFEKESVNLEICDEALRTLLVEYAEN